MISSKVEQYVTAEYKKAEHTGWSCRTTPTFPAEWPLRKGSHLIAYGYVYNIPENMRDGEKQAGPYCKVEINPSNPNEPTVSPIKYDLNDTGTQGVRPIFGKELETARSSDKVQSLMIEISHGKTASASDLELIKEFYKYWQSANFVMAKRIEKHHKDFFAWLEEH